MAPDTEQTEESSPAAGDVSGGSALLGTVADNTITEDFNNLGDDWWGMTGSLVDEGKLSLGDDSAGGKYLRMNGEKYATRTGVKVFADLPDMGTATIAFDWYTTALTSDSSSGRPGITLKSGDVEVVSVYMGEARNSAQTASAYYSVQGSGITKIDGKTLNTKAANQVSISVNFDTDNPTATISVSGTEFVKDISINKAASKVDTLVLNMAGGAGGSKTYTIDMGIDNFSMEYTEYQGPERVNSYVTQVSALPDMTATKADQENGEFTTHPASVEVTLSNETTETLQLENWNADKEFHADDIGTYVWTADLAMPEDGHIINPLDLKASYTMKYMSDFLETDIDSLVDLPTVTVTKEQWTSGTYKHPDKVAAKLVNTSVISVPIDGGSWTSEPVFDAEAKGTYVWTADILAPEGNRNKRNLKASYTMNYYGSYTPSHDYENDFSFGIMDWDVWGKDVDKDSGTGGYGLEIKEEDGNGYLYGEVEKSGAGRGSRLNLLSEIIKGATVEFDWRPEIVASGHADLLFLSPAAMQNYFSLSVGTDGKISYYTAPGLNNDSEIDGEFDGVIKEGSAEATNVGKLKEWQHVKIEFDYINHTAKLTVNSKTGGESFAKDSIPISPDANGLSLIVMRKGNSCSKSGNALDNIFVDYEKFGAKDIVSVVNPPDINMTKALYPSFEFPAEVTVRLGDSSSVEVKAGTWTSEPEFNPETENQYQWTAPLEPGEGYTNYFNLSSSFSMNYTLKNYVTSVNNPSTLELEFGTGWSEDDLVKTVTVVLSDGSVVNDAPVGEWKPIRAFNSAEEGIYIYGADLAEDDRYTSGKDKITPNEQHVNESDELKSSFVYDAYYRISYFRSGNNYNGYTRSMEYLDRGVTAVPSGSGILVSWRLLIEEYQSNIQFNVLRNGEIVNPAPLASKTNYLDAGGKAGDSYAVQVIKDGKKSTTEAVEALSQNYLSVRLQKPGPQMDKDGNFASYSINDAGVADVDGDGVYEIVVKWIPSDAFDSGKQDGPSAPTIFDCYRMDGTPLWRLNMGLELPSGAHWNQFLFYDLDEDGSAEFFVKTSDGTVSYKPNAEGKFDMKDSSTEVSYIGDRNVIPGTNVNGTGHVNENSNEYITVFNGRTGEAIDTISYVNAVDRFDDYGDDWGNRASRFNIALAYLPTDKNDPGCTTTIPAVLLNRGYYEKTTVAAYTLRSGKLQLEWNFDTDEAGSQYKSKGNHNMATGDVDKDGFDELVLGALALDHDGTVLWAKDGTAGQDTQGHADAIHLAAMNPEKPTQLYVFTPSEHSDATLNGTLSNAANGSRINGIWSAPADIGRGVAANITPNPGFEYWANRPNNEENPTGAIFNFGGDVIASTPPSTFTTNWVSYWDGDLLSELPDGKNAGGSGTEQAIYKYDWETNSMNRIAVLEGTHTNNSTKNNPSLTADLFGDWREEIMAPAAGDEELRIYMTDYETDYMIYCLMQDPVYRNAVANQNTAYNQPPHLGFYLGEDNAGDVKNMLLPKPNLSYTTVHPFVEDPADKEKLEEEFNEAVSENLAEGDYSESSYEAYLAALELAQNLLNDPDATQEEVDAALNGLISARKGLVPISDLKTKVEEAMSENLIPDGYTAESYQAYEEALKKAQEVLNDPDATQEEVDAALAALEEARNALVPAPQNVVPETSQGQGSEPSEETGNGNSAEEILVSIDSPNTADGNPDMSYMGLLFCLGLLLSCGGAAILCRGRMGRGRK